MIQIVTRNYGIDRTNALQRLENLVSSETIIIRREM